MPLIVKESSWRQTPAKVFIYVCLNNVPTHRVDVFTSERYVKLHYGNYIFEKLLLHPINEETSVIRLENNEAEFELVKVEQVMWDTLEVQVSKKEAIDLKIELMENHREKVNREAEEMSTRKDKRSKQAVTVQLKLDTDEQSTVTKLREQQKWEALSGNYTTEGSNTKRNEEGVTKDVKGVEMRLEEPNRNDEEIDASNGSEKNANNKTMARNNHVDSTNNGKELKITNKALFKSGKNDINLPDKELPKNNTYHAQQNTSQHGLNSGLIDGRTIQRNKKLGIKRTDKAGEKIEDDEEHKGVIITELTDEDVERINKEREEAAATKHKQLMDKITRQVRARIKAEEALKARPLVRSQGQIGVTFTPRVFPTPMRESMAPEEEEWLRKQAEARQACGFIAADLRPEENNPDWVKAKGDQMFKMGNYLGAVSAYSHGLKLCPNLASLYSNRAAAHIALNNLHKAADDASEAIKLLTPPCEANRKSRIQAHVRRATALCGLKVPKLGVLDFEAALALSPQDEKLREDTNRARQLAAEMPEDESDEIDLSSPPLIVTR